MHSNEDCKAQPYLLHNQIQHYAWGSRGATSFIPQLLGIAHDADTPYAELWMGAHPKASSVVHRGSTTATLKDWVQQQPHAILGTRVAAAFDGQWPFLFKILSIAAPLSIQAHPNRSQAQALHARDPEHYPDANHKPEIAIALDSLTALVGFKEFAGIVTTLHTYPEIAAFIGSQATVRQATTMTPSTQREAVRHIYTTLMRRAIADTNDLTHAIDQLASRLAQASTHTGHERLFLTARQTYKGADVGLFALFFLNLVHLKRGQGIFLAPGIPHAYVKGNIVECMANSDNVVRVGLTPKFKDVDTLVDILTYELGAPPILEPLPATHVVNYPAPVPEFSVRRLRLSTGMRQTHKRPETPAIWLITEGTIQLDWGTESATFKRGQSVLLPAILREVTVTALQDAEVFLAGVPM